MKYEVRKVDTNKQIVQITTIDERWYGENDVYVPSVTWIASYWPKGRAFERWQAEKGLNEAELIKREAGARGSRIHHAIEALLLNEEIKINSPFKDSDNIEADLAADEWWSIMTFVDWYKANKPKTLLIERSGINPKANYGGTLDYLCEIDGVIWLIDFKTSASIYKSHELQVSALKRLLPHIKETAKLDITTIKTALLQVGYKKNKAGFKFTEIDDKFDLFMHARAIWEEEVAQKLPLQKDYPLSLKL